MELLKITDYQYQERIEKLAKNYSASVMNDCEEHSFKFDSPKGVGIVRGINFDHGVSLMMLDLNLKQDTTFQFSLGRRHPIHFMYSTLGSIELRTVNDDIEHQLDINQSFIYAPQGNTDYEITIRANQSVRLLTVSIVRFLFLRKIECDIETIPDVLKEMFADTTGLKSFYFKTASEPITANSLINLFKSDQTGLERKILLEANSLKLITTLVKQFRVESTHKTGSYRFSSEDIRQINLAKNYIIDNINTTPKVKEISQVIGMNTNKLQKGFHMLFGKSIRQFTISLKMHMALSMIDEGNLSISQIAHKVGYTNKGHLSQLFKKEFGLLPSEYASRIPIGSRG